MLVFSDCKTKQIDEIPLLPDELMHVKINE